MKVIGLFGQRIGRYEGEYAPELLEAIDEYGNEDNPDFLNDAETKYKNAGEFSILKRISIEIKDEDFHRVFDPENKPIPGAVHG